MNNKIIVFGLVLVFLLSGTVGIVSALSNSGGGDWNYYDEITIKENSGKTLTDYQVLVELSAVNFPTQSKSDGSDLRFEDASGKELNYWIEEWDYGAKEAKIWVKVPSIPANGETKIKMYYGNEMASAVSDGDKVFEFFDDFEGGSLDTDKWTDVSTADAHIEVTGGNLRMYTDSGTNPSPAIVSDSAVTGELIIEDKRKISQGGWATNNGFILQVRNEHSVAPGIYDDGYDRGYWGDKTQWNNGGYWNGVRIDNVKSGPDLSTDTWYEFITYLLSDHLDVQIVGGVRTDLSITNDCTGNSNYIVVWTANSKDDGNWEELCDYIRVRKYASTEPTVTISPTTQTPTITPTPTPTISPSPTPSPTITPTPTLIPTKAPIGKPQLTISQTTLIEEPEVGEDTLITVTISNTGNGIAKNVNLREHIPSSVSINYVDGANSAGNLVTWGGDLDVGQTYSIIHSFRILEEKNRAVPVKVTYEDEDGKRYETSATIYISAKAEEISTPTPIPGFKAVFAIAGLLAVAYLLIKKKNHL